MDLSEYIRRRLETRKILLMTHVIAGYPSLEDNWRMLELMAEADVDLVELQMPFSEPVADGPTFVRANQIALERGFRLDEYFELVRRATECFDFPHLMMGYYNTVFRLGHENFCRRLQESGGAGFILPDLPLEEYGDLFELGEERGLNPVLLMTPTNTSQRLAELGRRATGFVYAVARRGVTGKKTALEPELYSFLDRCRSVTDVPLALGFGLQSGEDLRRINGIAEIGIVGSALLEKWEEGGESLYKPSLMELADSRV